MNNVYDKNDCRTLVHLEDNIICRFIMFCIRTKQKMNSSFNDILS